MSEIRLIPDNTFYTFFLKNNREKELIKINKFFKTCISPLVKKELTKLKSISNELNRSFLNIDPRMEYFKLLEPLLSRSEYEKGEFDIIILASLCKDLRLEFLFVIDDGPAFNVVKRYFSNLLPNHRRTGRFIVECHKIYEIFNKEESLELLELMKSSDFRIKVEFIETLKKDLEDG